MKAHQKEIDDVIAKGYPDTINDKQVISIYSNILRDIDLQREEQRKLQEARDRTTKIESLREQGFGSFSTVADTQNNYTISSSPSLRPAKAE